MIKIEINLPRKLQKLAERSEKPLPPRKMEL